MGNTFNAFIAFISEDPIMLGLCIAIIVLIIMFILVLIIGKKKDKKEEATIENTSTELLKTEINMDTLKSTNEYKIEDINPGLPSLEETKKESEPIAEEIPVTTEEPIKVEIEDKTSNSVQSEIILEPIIENTEDTKENEISEPLNVFENFNTDITKPEELVINNDTTEKTEIIESTELPVQESPTINEEIIEKPEEELINQLDIIDSTSLPVTEEKIEPVNNFNIDEVFASSNTEPITEEEIPVTTEEPATPNLYDSLEELNHNIFDADILEYTKLENEETKPSENTIETEDNIPEYKTEITPTEIVNEPAPVEEQIEEIKSEELPTMTEEEPTELPDYSDLYSVEDIELPNFNFDEMNNNPFNTFENQQTNEPDDEDLALPKLNKSSSSTINSLQGESFNID